MSPGAAFVDGPNRGVGREGGGNIEPEAAGEAEGNEEEEDDEPTFANCPLVEADEREPSEPPKAQGDSGPAPRGIEEKMLPAGGGGIILCAGGTSDPESIVAVKDWKEGKVGRWLSAC